jgi:hypothetical protein
MNLAQKFFFVNTFASVLTIFYFSVRMVEHDGTPQKGGENNGNNFS